MNTGFHSLMFTILALLGSLPIIAQDQIGGDIDGEASRENAGYSIALSADGQKVAVGASGNNANGNTAGQVRIYEWTGIEWTQLGEGINGEAAFDNAGRGLSLSPDGLRVAVGAYMNDADGSLFDAGHVRIYEWNGIEWIQLGEDINGKGFIDWTGLGESISISGNRFAVGAPGQGNEDHVSYVRIFEWDEIEWTQLGVDIVGEAPGDRSGVSISLSNDGNRIAIGASSNDGNGFQSGHVRVYEWNSIEWTQMGQDIDGEAASDVSGGSVSLSDEGHRIAIGSTGNDGNGNRSGHVRVYEWNNFEWTQMGEDIDGKGPNAYSGRSVSLSSSGNVVAIGGCTSSVVDSDPGHMSIYKWDGISWNQFGEVIEGEAANDWFGFSVSLSSDGQTVASGAFRNDGNGEEAGHVRVFDLTNITSSKQDISYDIGAYPNPTKDYLWLKGIKATTTYTVINNFGKVVMTGSYTNKEDLDLSNLSAGIYYLKLNTERGSINKKIIKL